MGCVPAKEEMAWGQKAMEVSENDDLSSQIELWIENKQSDRVFQFRLFSICTFLGNQRA